MNELGAVRNQRERPELKELIVIGDIIDNHDVFNSDPKLSLLVVTRFVCNCHVRLKVN